MPGQIRGIEVDTSFFTGNHSPRCSVQAAFLTEEQLRIVEALTAMRDDFGDKDKVPPQFEREGLPMA